MPTGSLPFHCSSISANSFVIYTISFLLIGFLHIFVYPHPAWSISSHLLRNNDTAPHFSLCFAHAFIFQHFVVSSFIFSSPSSFTFPKHIFHFSRIRFIIPLFLSFVRWFVPCLLLVTWVWFFLFVFPLLEMRSLKRSDDDNRLVRIDRISSVLYFVKLFHRIYR